MKVGLDCKAYYLASGRATWGTATNGVHSGVAPVGLTEAGEIQDVTLNLEKTVGDASIRASKYDLVTKTGARVLSIDVTLPTNEGSTIYGMLRDAYFGNTTVAMAFLSAAATVADSEGPWADWAVVSFGRSEARSDGSMITATLKPAINDLASPVYPEWVKTTLT